MDMKSAVRPDAGASRPGLDDLTTFGDVFDAMPDALAVTTRDDGRVLAVNQAWTRLLGVSRADAVGRTSVELGLWPDETQRRLYLDHLDDASRVHTWFVGRAGQRRVRMRSAVLDASGRELILVSITDAEAEVQADEERAAALTALRQANLALQVQVELHRAVEALARVGTWTNPVGSDEVIWSDGMRDIVAFDHPQPLTQDVARSRIHPDDLPAWLQAREALDGRDLDFRWARTDGEQRWLRTRMCRTQVEGIAPTDIGIVQDVTVEVLAQTRLQAQLDLLQRVAARVPGIMYQARLTPEGETELVFVSEVARRMLQLAPHESEHDARVLFSRVHPDDLPTMLGSLREAALALKVWRHPYRVRLPDGSVRWHQAEAVPVREPTGAVLWHGYTSDVTDQRASQAAVEALNAHLEQRVRERTADLERATRDMEAIAYSIAHDLRTPLRSINGFASLVADQSTSGLTPECRVAIDRIVGASGRMGRMLTELLHLLEIVRADLVAEEVDVAALVTDIDRQLGIGASGVRLCVAPDMPRAMADGPLLAQALRHLLDNAVRFSRLRAAPVIEVGFDATQRAWFVRDNGIGFEPAQAERLFGLFQRLHADPTDPGLGIGLAIVARIIERHEGAVWADSVPGEGATFWLRIGPRGIAAPEA